ncbi:MAG: hypothetical protein SF182_28550 [Deltaproteobacteria bacterium]|nr:hypothetical protein [Deltaproteobacteria bacterium]
MKPINIDREMQELVASEEVLAFFDFMLPIEGAAAVEGLCKVSRPRERRSKSTYLSVFFIIDAHDPAVQRGVEQHMRRVDWNAVGESTPGVDCFVAIPNRGATGGLVLKEVDVFLDGTRAPDVAFVSEVLQPAMSRAADLRPGAVTVWDEVAPAAAGAAAPAAGGGLLGRLRRAIQG